MFFNVANNTITEKTFDELMYSSSIPLRFMSSEFSWSSPRIPLLLESTVPKDQNDLSFKMVSS